MKPPCAGSGTTLAMVADVIERGKEKLPDVGASYTAGGLWICAADVERFDFPLTLSVRRGEGGDDD